MTATKVNPLVALLLLIGIIGFMYFVMGTERPLPTPEEVRNHEFPKEIENRDIFSDKSREKIAKKLEEEDDGIKAYVYIAYTLRRKKITENVDGYQVVLNRYDTKRFDPTTGAYQLYEGELVKYGVAKSRTEPCGCDTPDFITSVRTRYEKEPIFYASHRFECVGLYSKNKAHAMETWLKKNYSTHADNERRKEIDGHYLIMTPKR